MREEGAVIALSPSLRRAVLAHDVEAVKVELRKQLEQHPSLVSVRVALPDGQELVSVDRGRPLDPEHENQLDVTRPLGDAQEGDDAPELQLVFAADKARFDELSEMGQFIDEATKAGVVVATGALQPTGTRLRLSSGAFTVTDGPFIELKELTGGFAVIETQSLEEAIEWSKRFRKIVGDGESEIVRLFGPSDFGAA